MGRRRIENKRVEDKSQEVTICKRRNWLLKKAYELSFQFNMGKRRIENKRIEDKSQEVAICKRLNWLLKKAYELSFQFNMGKRRIENKRIEDKSQEVTICKRRNGLLKKAYELSAVLCYAVVALSVFVFSSRGRLYERVRQQQQVMSSPMKLASFWILLASFLLWSILPLESVSSDWNFHCENERFKRYSQYEKILNNIAEKLPAQVSLAPSYFYSVGSSSESEHVYAAGSCREDNSPTDCKICIRQAFRGVGAWCPFRKVAAIVYDRCSLWISNREFVDLNFNSISFLRFNKSRAPIKRDILGKIVVGVVRVVAEETAKSPARFATAQQQIGGVANGYTVYAFAQCIPIAARDCIFCLEDLISGNVFLATSVGGESSALWCQFRWELYPFITGVTHRFIIRVTSTPADGKQWKRDFVILSAAGSAVLAILAVSLIAFSVQLWRKNRLQRHTLMTMTPTGERIERVETASLEMKRVETEEGSSSKVPESSAMPGTPKRVEESIGNACSRMDLSAIHQILVTTHYRDDEGSTELSFEGWTHEVRDVLGARERGDSAFENKQFRIAIGCYSQFVDAGRMVSPTVYARRSLCYLMCDDPGAALRDAMIAETVYPDWPTAFYMQSVALSKMNMQSDAVDMLTQASQLEEMRRQKTT